MRLDDFRKCIFYAYFSLSFKEARKVFFVAIVFVKR